MEFIYFDHHTILSEICLEIFGLNLAIAGTFQSADEHHAPNWCLSMDLPKWALYR